MISALQLQHAEARESAFLYLMRMQRSWPDLQTGCSTTEVFNGWWFENIDGLDYFLNDRNKAISYWEYHDGRAHMLQIVAQCYPNISEYARINGKMNLGVKR